jgi:hypothetical protein
MGAETANGVLRKLSPASQPSRPLRVDRTRGRVPSDACRAKPALKGSRCASLEGGLDHTHRAEAREREAVLASPVRSAETTGSR